MICGGLRSPQTAVALRDWSLGGVEVGEMNEIDMGASREAAVVRAAYAALNRGDVAGFVAAFDVDVVRVEPAGPDTAGTYRADLPMLRITRASARAAG